MDETRTIELTQGYTAIVDAADFGWLSVFKWWVTNHQVDGRGYCATTISGRKVYMHRLIVNAPADMLVDHINGNRLDNRRSNLRLATRNGNARNSKFRSHNTSGFRGVSYCKDTGRWRAEIRVNGKGVKLGRFDTREEAAHVYDVAARQHHGEFAVLNFPVTDGFVPWREFTSPSDPGAVGKGCGE